MTVSYIYVTARHNDKVQKYLGVVLNFRNSRCYFPTYKDLTHSNYLFCIFSRFSTARKIIGQWRVIHATDEEAPKLFQKRASLCLSGVTSPKVCVCIIYIPLYISIYIYLYIYLSIYRYIPGQFDSVQLYLRGGRLCNTRAELRNLLQLGVYGAGIQLALRYRLVTLGLFVLFATKGKIYTVSGGSVLFHSGMNVSRRTIQLNACCLISDKGGTKYWRDAGYTEVGVTSESSGVSKQLSMELPHDPAGCAAVVGPSQVTAFPSPLIKPSFLLLPCFLSAY